MGMDAAVDCGISTAAVRSGAGMCERRMLMIRKLELCGEIQIKWDTVFFIMRMERCM